MTFIVKHTRSDRPIVAEYLCPVHGKFTLEIQRDENGDPPDAVACPTTGPVARLSALEVQCGVPSPYCVSAPSVRVRAIEAVRGKWEKPERPTYTDTRNLGEGQSLDDWKSDREAVWERQREADVMEMRRELG